MMGLRGFFRKIGAFAVDVLNFEPSLTEIPSYQEGLVFYHPDDKALSFYSDIEGISLQIGEEQWARGKNTSGAEIEDGKVIYISGALGNRPTYEKARADDFDTAKVIGVATHDIAINQDGIATTFGLVRDVDTTGDDVLETWADGEILYVSATGAGEMTNVPPSAPNLSIPIAIVLNAHATQGILFVRAHFPVNFPQVYGVNNRDDHGTISAEEDFSANYTGHTITTGTSHTWTLSGFTAGLNEITTTLTVSGGTPTITLPGTVTIATDSPMQSFATLAAGIYLIKIYSPDAGTSHILRGWAVS